MFLTKRPRADKILSIYRLLINYNVKHQLHVMSIGKYNKRSITHLIWDSFALLSITHLMFSLV